LNRARIPQRTRVYLGCEGQSEQSYGRLLSAIAEALGRHIYIDNDVLRPGGGDPLDLVQMAVRRADQRERKRGGAFAYRAILLDRDKLGQTPGRDRLVAPLAEENGLSLIWQTPCHEGFLLRHFEGQEATRPVTSGLAMQALQRIWPEYYKGMPAIQLATRINTAAIRRASRVEQVLAEFLDQIGIQRAGER
jgi:hypothetical protein